ncbi:RHTO0S05e08240g1_1 [Rhodotorula toruloides]|uniref:RHTO0S05e08240g1_1 n=1 Tax=Rhodotorula toruloides TaxID=5286 RepID=A0A061AZQ6_RHOTO|nr:RHTO0S05e08240g1_1 [Rhodotorula toruloides]
MLAIRSAASPTSPARCRFFATHSSCLYGARPLPFNSPANAVRRGPAKADSDEQAFEAKLAAEPAEAPVRRLSLYDTLLADVEAGKGMRRSKEDGEQPYKEVKEPVKPKPKPARAMKREAEAAVQAELRAKWPDSFNYTDYNPRLVLAASDALIQEELRRMNGFVRFLHPDLARLSAPWDSQAVRVRSRMVPVHSARRSGYHRSHPNLRPPKRPARSPRPNELPAAGCSAALHRGRGGDQARCAHQW